MDQRSSSSPRITYSFPEGTFDLDRLCPGLCFEIDGGHAAAVQLDGRWPRFFRSLSELGLIMASVSSGPLNMAIAWGSPNFQSYPGASEWICLDSGAEIQPAAFGSGLVLIEPCGDQQVASFQFFDRQGQGCLKLLLTNGSDLAAFEKLVTAHASPHRRQNFGQKRETKLETASPDTVMVRQLWNGLSRTLPDSHFPGLDGIARRAALEVAGEDLAWRLSYWVVRQALQQMTLAQAPLGGALRNEAVFLPAGITLTRWGHCHCGMTFFGPNAQLTLPRCGTDFEAWALRFTDGHHEAICMELYDQNGRYHGGLGLLPEASPQHQAQWNQLLLRDGQL